jgi:hypothetical protein
MAAVGALVPLEPLSIGMQDFAVGGWQLHRDGSTLNLQSGTGPLVPPVWSRSHAAARLRGPGLDVRIVPHNSDSLKIDGVIAVDNSGLRPLDSFVPGPLPERQQGLLTLSLAGDGRLSEQVVDLLQGISQRLAAPRMRPEDWQNLSGEMLLTWRYERSQSLLSIAFAHEPSAKGFIQLMDKDVAVDQVFLAAQRAAQPLRGADGRLWWLRLDSTGLWWFSLDQQLLAQRVLGNQEATAPFTVPAADTLVSLQLRNDALQDQANTFLKPVTHVTAKPGVGAPLKDVARRLGRLGFAVLDSSNVSHLELAAHTAGRTALRWWHPEGLLFSLWWLHHMEQIAQQEQRHQRRMEQIQRYFLRWRRGELVRDRADDAGILLPWPVDNRSLRVVLVDRPQPDGQQGAFMLFSDGTLLWLPQAMALYRRAQQIQRILVTGHPPREPWGALRAIIQGAYNLHHTGDATVSPH